MEPMKPTSCQNAPCVATLEEHTVHIRRGDKTIEAPRWYWRCLTCKDPIEDGPYEFVDSALMDRNDAAARDGWVRKFAESLPAARRPGRKPEEPKTERVTVLLTPSEVKVLDRKRGDRTRSEFIRGAVFTRRTT